MRSLAEDRSFLRLLSYVAGNMESIGGSLAAGSLHEQQHGVMSAWEC